MTTERKNKMERLLAYRRQQMQQQQLRVSSAAGQKARVQSDRDDLVTAQEQANEYWKRQAVETSGIAAVIAESLSSNERDELIAEADRQLGEVESQLASLQKELGLSSAQEQLLSDYVEQLTVEDRGKNEMRSQQETLDSINSRRVS